MNTALLSKIAQALPIVISITMKLVQSAETVFDGSGWGKWKKNFVFEGLREYITAMEFFSTGGQKETWAEILSLWDDLSPAIGSMIDVMAAFFFPKD